ncbi:MAG: hypothetical protein WC011_00935 [Candidatus Paceibacterota bacterium]
MENYTLMYIDEESAEMDRMERNLGSDFEIKNIDFTDITFDKLTTILDKREFDYLIVDFNLNERSNCGFNGDDVLVNFTKKFPHFPVMLLTNFDHRAVASVKNIDTEKIHNKKEHSDTDLKMAFIKRIKGKIIEYKERNSQAETRAEELIHKKNSGAEMNINEEEELIKLDTFLDEVTAGDASIIPSQMKELSNETKLLSLLEKTDALISKLENYEAVQE